MKNLCFVFCCGFPKCGTTTVAALLDSFDECSLHILKEPNFFLEGNVLTAEYVNQFPVKNAKYLVDFSTFYGLKSKRKKVLENIEAAGLIERSRFVVCIRDPADQSISYLRHIRTRRSGNADSIQASIEDAQDFRQCIKDLLGCASPERIFVVKFEDIQSQEAQNNLCSQLRAWLALPTLDISLQLLRLNSVEDYAEYRGVIKTIVEAAKKAGLGRFLSLRYRQSLRKYFGVKIEKYALSDEDLEIVNSLQYWDASNFYLEARTGVLNATSVDT